eukprot:GFYU01009482.1.p1 GENE.GFYU01009482.1~~GFYU01009482.1.p1  ORF type:complete len:316 (+),score=84.22 GFYU01009482.1:127-948(+)
MQDSVHSVMKRLAKHHILSVPVEDKRQEGTFLCTLDVMDIVRYFVLSATASGIGSSYDPSILNNSVDDLLNQVKTASATVWMKGCHEEDFLAEAVAEMSMGHKRLHVKASKTEKLLTQTDVLRSVWKNVNKFEDSIVGTRLADITGKHHQVITIPTAFTAWEAFQLMSEHKFQQLPVVHDQQIVAIVSPSDLRGLSDHTFEHLHLPVLEFLRHQHGGKTRPPVTCKVNDTVADALEKMCPTGIHRLFIVTQHGHVVSDVSQGDLIKFLFPVEK